MYVALWENHFVRFDYKRVFSADDGNFVSEIHIHYFISIFFVALSFILLLLIGNLINHKFFKLEKCIFIFIIIIGY